VDHSVCRIS